MEQAGKHVVVGIGGGAAAYKACMVIRGFVEAGHRVTAIPTAAAERFIGRATLEALTGQPVGSSVFEGVLEVRHVQVGADADLVVVVPATADLLSRVAQGAADDMLTTTLLVASCPVLLAPAMHSQMWGNSIVQRNVAVLREHGFTVMEPAVGRLTGAGSGVGRLPDPVEIVEMGMLLWEEELREVAAAVATSPGVVPLRPLMPRDLVGQHVVVTAGGTREAIDPVRFIANSSSGMQGAALAACAVQRGASVTLVVGAHSLPFFPAGVEVRHAMSAREMAAKVQHCVDSRRVDAVIMAAAVADFRPVQVAHIKLKKDSQVEPESIALTRNPDVLAGLVVSHPEVVTVGFAAETGDGERSVLELGREKFERKGCDMLMVNEVGFGKTFGQSTNGGWLLRRPDGVSRAADVAGSDGVGAGCGEGLREVQIPEMSKRGVAMRILDELVTVLAAR